jgi:hypothetical protein
LTRLGPAVLLASAALSPAGAQERLPWAEPARACLDGDTRAFATLHGDVAGGAVRLVVHRADGTRELCEVEPAGRLRGRAPAPSGAYAPRSEDRAFFLERRCVDARRVESESGAILGWLAYPACG